MARVNLFTRPAFGVRYQHPSERPGTTTLIPTYHLGIRLFVASLNAAPKWRPADSDDPSRTFRAILDTGAPLTIIPYNVWQVFADDVQILAQPSADSEYHVGGGPQNGQLGRVRLGALDGHGNWMPADWTVAIFLDPPTTPDAPSLLYPLIGLNAHFFTHNRRLRHVRTAEDENFADVPEWRLEDRSRLLPW